METWKIQKVRTRCDKPGCTLAADQEFYAILQLPECVRLERCGSCFHELQRQTEEMPFHWKVRRTKTGSQPMLDLESLRVLFDRLGDAVAAAAEASPAEASTAEASPAEVADGEPDPGEDLSGDGQVRDAAGLRYLLALLLIRKRRLKMVDPKNEEQEQADLVVADPKLPDAEPIALHAPDFDPERLDSLRDELMAAMGEDPEAQATEAGVD